MGNMSDIKFPSHGYCCPSCGYVYDTVEYWKAAYKEKDILLEGVEENFKACKNDYDKLNAECAILEAEAESLRNLLRECQGQLISATNALDNHGNDWMAGNLNRFIRETF